MADEDKTPVKVKGESAQDACARAGMKRIEPYAPYSPITKAYSLENNRVMVLCEDGSRIWFTPGEFHGDEELQADYRGFLQRTKS